MIVFFSIVYYVRLFVFKFEMFRLFFCYLLLLLLLLLLLFDSLHGKTYEEAKSTNRPQGEEIEWIPFVCLCEAVPCFFTLCK